MIVRYKRGVVNAVCVLPHHAPLAFELRFEKFRGSVCQLSDCVDPELLKPCGTAFADHEKLAHGERPHFYWNLLLIECVDAVGFFKVAGHFCKQLIRIDSDVDRKTNRIPYLIGNRSCGRFR